MDRLLRDSPISQLALRIEHTANPKLERDLELLKRNKTTQFLERKSEDRISEEELPSLKLKLAQHSVATLRECMQQVLVVFA